MAGDQAIGEIFAHQGIFEPALLEHLANDAAIGVGSSPAEFAAFIAQEQKRWKLVVARAKIKPDN